MEWLAPFRASCNAADGSQMRFSGSELLRPLNAIGRFAIGLHGPQGVAVFDVSRTNQIRHPQTIESFKEGLSWIRRDDRRGQIMWFGFVRDHFGPSPGIPTRKPWITAALVSRSNRRRGGCRAGEWNVCHDSHTQYRLRIPPLKCFLMQPSQPAQRSDADDSLSGLIHVVLPAALLLFHLRWLA